MDFFSPSFCLLLAFSFMGKKVTQTVRWQVNLTSCLEHLVGHHYKVLKSTPCAKLFLKIIILVI